MQLLMADVQVLEMVALVIMIILQQEVAALFQIAMMMPWPIIQAQIFLLSVLLLKSIWLKVMGSIKNKVVLKERDVWSDLANFIGEMVAKYAEAMDLGNLPDPDFYLRRERIRQLYTELYKEKNITQFRNTKISIERKVAA
mgnify:FL=1